MSKFIAAEKSEAEACSTWPPSLIKGGEQRMSACCLPAYLASFLPSYKVQGLSLGDSVTRSGWVLTHQLRQPRQSKRWVHMSIWSNWGASQVIPGYAELTRTLVLQNCGILIEYLLFIDSSIHANNSSWSYDSRLFSFIALNSSHSVVQDSLEPVLYISGWPWTADPPGFAYEPETPCLIHKTLSQWYKVCQTYNLFLFVPFKLA